MYAAHVEHVAAECKEKGLTVEAALQPHMRVLLKYLIDWLLASDNSFGCFPKLLPAFDKISRVSSALVPKMKDVMVKICNSSLVIGNADTLRTELDFTSDQLTTAAAHVVHIQNVNLFGVSI